MSEHQNRQPTKDSKSAPQRAFSGAPVLFSPVKNSRGRISTRTAFTLIELLVVISIIGILAAIGLPAMRGFGSANTLASTTRQLQDDVTLARQRAISGHTDVYMVFIPPGIVNFNYAALNAKDRQLFNNLAGGQYTTYALFAFRGVGEQPGRTNPRYLTAWKTLPEGMFIATNKFGVCRAADPDYARGFLHDRKFPFPTGTNATTINLPYIAFDYQGRLAAGRADDQTQQQAIAPRDAFIPLARGSIFYGRNPDGTVVIGPADVKESPPGNSITTSNQIHVEWLTGRARLDSQQVQ